MDGILSQFEQAFIYEDRWLLLLQGLRNTIIITVFALILGLIIGFISAIICATHDKRGGWKIPHAICRVYLTVIRGTPTVIQLMIMYYVILVSVTNSVLVAILAFGINSGAYIWMRDSMKGEGPWAYPMGRPCGLSYSPRR